MNKIGLDRDDVSDRIKRGLLPYKNKEDQKRKCEKVYKEMKSIAWKVTESPPRRIMTAAKSKTKRPEEQEQTTAYKEDPRHKATSSKPKIEQDGRKERKTIPVGINTTMHRRMQRDLQGRTKVGRM